MKFCTLHESCSDQLQLIIYFVIMWHISNRYIQCLQCTIIQSLWSEPVLVFDLYHICTFLHTNTVDVHQELLLVNKVSKKSKRVFCHSWQWQLKWWQQSFNMSLGYISLMWGYLQAIYMLCQKDQLAAFLWLSSFF